MYEIAADPYCYPGTTLLKNVPDIRNAQDLADFEAAITAQRGEEVLPGGRLSLSHYRAVHRHIFQDVYPWAGQFRTVRISKGASLFCYPEHIRNQMRSLFADLRTKALLRGLDRDAFVRSAARFLSTLNAIHPFRDGNGRTQLAFMGLPADRAGHPLDWERLDPGAMLDAMIASFAGDDQPLVAQLASLTA